MEDVFGEAGGKCRVSLADSTMMLIVHRAMDKAHDRAQQPQGPIECLTSISMFYELAVMLLEGCLKFLQDESDCTLETTDEQIIRDLAEIRDRLLGSLKDAELAISEKDKELATALRNEVVLKKALQDREKECRDGEFSGLKHSVDQQVWSIKQKLEPETKLLDRRRNRSCDNFDIEVMGIDIDALKETMDVAFGKMQSVIISTEIEPIEQQWMWTIEKDVFSVLIKGFMRDIQGNFDSREKKISMYFLDSMKEIKSWHDALQTLCQFESLKPFGRTSSALNSQDNSSDEEDLQDDGGNLVAKMIKNHESIIKKKRKEVNREKRRSSYPWVEEDLVSPRTRMHDVIARMERLMDQSETFGKSFSHYEVMLNKTSISEKVYEAFRGEVKLLKEEEEASLQTMIMKKTCATLLKGLISDSGKEKLKIVSKLNDQMESDKVDFCIKEDIQYEVFKNVVRDFFMKMRSSLERNDIEEHVRDEMHRIASRGSLRDLTETVDDVITELKDSTFEGMLREEVFAFLLTELWKDITETEYTEKYFPEKMYQIALEEIIREFTLSKKSDRSQYICKGCIWTEKRDSDLKFSVDQTASSEMMEGALIRLKHEKLNKMKNSRKIISEMRNTCSSMNCRVTKALDHLVMSKAVVNEFRSCLFVPSESEMKKPSIEGVKVVAPTCSAFIPMMDFLQVFVEFKCRVEESLELNIIKLEGAMQDLNQLSEVFTRERRQKWLYQRAFLNRCENLRKAEDEVDLLGNQVEILLGLLEKIYNVLHQYSPVLQQYFEVSHILKMIRKELVGEVFGCR